jgi:hypothetical protein
MGGWFNKEINSAADFKGLKMRIPGLGGDVLAKLGASPVSLPGGQIYENLVSGAIDATEWVGPYNDYFMKFYEAAKFYYYPGMHEPGSMPAMGFNKSWLSKLSKTDQGILEAVCNEENARQMAETTANNGIYLTKLVKEHGVKLKKFSDEVYDSFGEAAEAVFAETRKHSALAAEIHDSFAKARTDIGGWSGRRGARLRATAFPIPNPRIAPDRVRGPGASSFSLPPRRLSIVGGGRAAGARGRRRPSRSGEAPATLRCPPHGGHGVGAAARPRRSGRNRPEGGRTGHAGRRPAAGGEGRSGPGGERR